MPASSPIRIDRSLFEQAAIEADRQKRSTPKQLEYWAELGMLLDGLVSYADALRLRQGLLKLEPVEAPLPDAGDVFSRLETMRADGSLSQRIAAGNPAYQISEQHPGYLEEVQPDGTVTVGQFERGKFKPKS